MYKIIPEPRYSQYSADSIVLDSSALLTFPEGIDGLESIAGEIQLYLSSIGIYIEVDASEDHLGTILFELLPKDTLRLEEYYEIYVSAKCVRILASSRIGFVNAKHTLLQILRQAELMDDCISLFCCNIKDHPAFKWRGFMLDVSRHFFPLADVLTFVSILAEYKFNILHLHLTDDEGWRIQIKSHPLLTEVGAWRPGRIGRFGERRKAQSADEVCDYGGFYTKHDINLLVEFAGSLGITIVPEIDMPGHCMALLAAYPDLSCGGSPVSVSVGHKFCDWQADGTLTVNTENTLDPGNQRVYELIDDVIREIAEMFSGPYIHIGGDECFLGFWEKSSSHQFMLKNGMNTPKELESYFHQRVCAIVKKYHKIPIGWDEITDSVTDGEAVIMAWRSKELADNASKDGYSVIYTPKEYTYLDFCQGDPSVENVVYGSTDLRRAYSFKIDAVSCNHKNVLGGQANLWTELIPNIDFAFYMSFPRAFAIIEELWSGGDKPIYSQFISKVISHIDIFEFRKLNVCRALYEPKIITHLHDGTLAISLEMDVPDIEVFYTIDNTYPPKFGCRYTDPFLIHYGDLHLRVQSYKQGKAVGRELVIHIDDLYQRAYK
ncbi:MAG: beta-N-acetylhexosaminidase [Pseudomonadota bacterium]